MSSCRPTYMCWWQISKQNTPLWGLHGDGDAQQSTPTPLCSMHTCTHPLYGCQIHNSAKILLTPFAISKNKPFCCMTTIVYLGEYNALIHPPSQHQYLHNKSDLSDYSSTHYLLWWKITGIYPPNYGSVDFPCTQSVRVPLFVLHQIRLWKPGA